MSQIIGRFQPVNSCHAAFDVASLEPSSFMDKPGYEGFKPDGSKFHVFNEHWKWIPEWNGEGLPPVGTMCELRCKTGGWGEAEIKYHGRAICVWLWVRSDGNTEQIEHAECPDRMEFRRIRTPEQITAEERKKSAVALYEAVMNFGNLAFDRLPLDRQEHYLKLVDAGWQQVKQ